MPSAISAILQLSSVYLLFMKKILTLLLITLLLYIPKPALAQTSVPILMYHYIGNNPNPKDKARDVLEVTPDKFEEQMTYLQKNGYTPINLDTLYGIFNHQTNAPAKPIVLTFDDGYIDFYTTAFPILSKYHFKAVSFIPTGLIGGGYYMNWDQIKQIQQSGLITFEGHTVHHANLPSLSPDQALKELKEGKETLQSKTGYPVNFIAYPYGFSNGFVEQLAKQAGFVGGLGTWYGKAGFEGMNIPRIRITGSMTLPEFASRI